MIQSYQQLNDAAKMMEVADKALGYKPDDLNTLMMLSNVMAERPPTNEDQKKTHLARAEELAKQGINQLPVFIASPEGAQLNNEQKGELASSLHYTLGLIYLHQKKFSDSEKEFGVALQAKANDPITYYRLGIAYAQDLKNDQAMDALAKSVFLKGVSEANARDILKQLYVQKNKSEQGLEDYIKAAGQKIGQ
jgi:tetratricopeptide (TPR) repeat protein